jgi:ribA/ribD-fused uncharacterized protein
MDYCSYFIKDKALFGSYPTQEQVTRLESLGVRYFVNLTCNGERGIKPYLTKYTKYHYPIQDRKVPRDWYTFAKFILRIVRIIKNMEDREKIYINCRGGHGRAGLVVAIILKQIYNISPSSALMLTNKFHSERKVMREKWRRIGSPQTKYQKTFVHKFFDDLTFQKATYHTGFSNSSKHHVNIEGMGTFLCSESAYQAHKDPENKDYVEQLLKCDSYILARKLGSTSNKPENWNDIKENVMYKVVKAKFTQNYLIRKNLLNTGLRNIVYFKRDMFWGVGSNGKGENKLGKILTKIRSELYLE